MLVTGSSGGFMLGADRNRIIIAFERLEDEDQSDNADPRGTGIQKVVTL